MKILNDILTEERLREGWSVKQSEDDVLELLYRGKLLARFSQTGISIEKLEHEIGKISKN